MNTPHHSLEKVSLEKLTLLLLTLQGLALIGLFAVEWSNSYIHALQYFRDHSFIATIAFVSASFSGISLLLMTLAIYYFAKDYNVKRYEINLILLVLFMFFVLSVTRGLRNGLANEVGVETEEKIALSLHLILTVLLCLLISTGISIYEYWRYQKASWYSVFFAGWSCLVITAIQFSDQILLNEGKAAKVLGIRTITATTGDHYWFFALYASTAMFFMVYLAFRTYLDDKSTLLRLFLTVCILIAGAFELITVILQPNFGASFLEYPFAPFSLYLLVYVVIGFVSDRREVHPSEDELEKFIKKGLAIAGTIIASFILDRIF